MGWSLDFAAGYFGGPPGRRDEVIAQLQLEPLLRTRIGALSKGQRKRAVLAIGWLTPQPLLLVDEPFDGLDLRQTREVGGALRRHAASGRTLFLSIHQIGDAARVCDRFVLLSNGRVRGSGTRDELCAQVRRPGSRRCRRSRRPSLRSPEAASWLLAKDWRELLASRAWWLMLALIGPLVGLSFTSAVRTYRELSGAGGTGSGVGEAFAPLVGVWAPTFSACELAAVFLLPFVAIRVVAGDRQSGALALERQHPLPPWVRIVTKSAVLLGGWLIASLAPMMAVLLWLSYGGTFYVPELATVMLGHLLNAGLTIALAAAAAMVADHPSTSAILTLAVTVGTWVIAFVAAVQGGIWEQAAQFTPTAMVAEFQHGLIRLDTVLVAIVLMTLGLTVATIWTRAACRCGGDRSSRPGRARRRDPRLRVRPRARAAGIPPSPG